MPKRTTSGQDTVLSTRARSIRNARTTVPYGQRTVVNLGVCRQADTTGSMRAAPKLTPGVVEIGSSGAYYTLDHVSACVGGKYTHTSRGGSKMLYHTGDFGVREARHHEGLPIVGIGIVDAVRELPCAANSGRLSVHVLAGVSA